MKHKFKFYKKIKLKLKIKKKCCPYTHKNKPALLSFLYWKNKH